MCSEHEHVHALLLLARFGYGIGITQPREPRDTGTPIAK